MIFVNTVSMARVNTLRPIQYGWHFTNDIFKCIFLNKDIWMINISLEFVPEDQINNIPALVQIMPWRRPDDKPLSVPMMIILLMHIYASLGLSELSWSYGITYAVIWDVPSCQAVGVTKTILHSCYFFIVTQNYQNTGCLLKIMFVFDRCHCSLAAATSVKY